MTTIIPAKTELPSFKEIPGPPATPILGKWGNIFQYFEDPIGYADKLFRTYGSAVSLVKGGRNVNTYNPEFDAQGSIFVYGPELTRQYSTEHEIFYRYPLTGRLYAKRYNSRRTEPLKHFLGGLFAVNGDDHRQHRRLVMPAFHKKRIEAYRDVMVQLTQSVLDAWKLEQNYDIANELRILTARVATMTLFSQDSGQDDAYAAKALADALSMLTSPVLHLAPYDIPGLPFHHFLNVIGRFDIEMHKIVAAKRQENKDNGDVLSMLLQTRDEESGMSLSEDEILGHVGVLFTAGHETSSNALTWTLLLLSQFPQWAAAAVDELDKVLHGEAPKVEQLGQLQVLERIIKESMRLLPPAPMRGSALSEATAIGGYLLPKGTVVFNSIYHTHHMSELYENPEEFQPDRWETIRPSIFEYNPFGGGARMCIGATFAMMELKIILAMVLQRYRLQCLPHARVDRFGIVTIAPKGGLMMTVHEQDRQFTRGVGGLRGNIREMVSLPE